MIRFEPDATSYRLQVNYEDHEGVEIGLSLPVLATSQFPDDLEAVALADGFEITAGPRGPVLVHRGYGAEISVAHNGPHHGPGHIRNATAVLAEVYDDHLVPDTGRDLRPKERRPLKKAA